MASQRYEARTSALKLQPTPGSFLAPVYATDSLLLLDSDSQVEAVFQEFKVDSSTFEAPPKTFVRGSGYVSGDIRLVGDATPGDLPNAALHLAILMAGHVHNVLTPNIVEYTPSSVLTQLGSMVFHHDGELVQIKDGKAVCGGFEFNVDSFAKMKGWRLDGALQSVGDAAIISGVYTEYQTPVGIQTANSICSVNGIEVAMYGLELTTNAKLESLPDTKALEQFLGARSPGITLRVKKEALSVVDWYALMQSGAEVPLHFAVWDNANVSRGVRFEVPKLQVQGAPKKANRNGQLVYEIPCAPLRNIVGDASYKLQLGTVAQTI